MERNEQIYDRIESYLLGEMTPKERQGFEEDMASDEALRRLVDQQRLELDAVEVLLENDLREQMQAWQTEEPETVEESGGGRIRPLYWVGIGLAAAILALIIFRVLLRPHTPGQEVVQQEAEPAPEAPETPLVEVQEPKPAQTLPERPSNTLPKKEPSMPTGNYLALATDAYELPPDLRGNLRSADETETSPLDAGLAAFEAKNYPEAIRELAPLTPEIGEDAYARAREILGHAYFLNKQYAEAARIFETLANDPDFESVRQYGEWYLLLSLLPNYDEHRTRIEALLNKMTDPANFHNYRAAAEQLKKELM